MYNDVIKLNREYKKEESFYFVYIEFKILQEYSWICLEDSYKQEIRIQERKIFGSYNLLCGG